jgi:glycerophosphoryl diester phosphodiesterase
MLLRGAMSLFCGILLIPTSSSGSLLSIGHRGNDLFAPENTVASFTAARGKAELMELDAQVTSDGQFVVMHDGTVDRTTDGTGPLRLPPSSTSSFWMPAHGSRHSSLVNGSRRCRKLSRQSFRMQRL